MLFTPKILGGILVIARGARQFGGGLGAALSVLLEIIFSALLAPIRMLFHTQFVLAALTGLGCTGRVRPVRMPRPPGARPSVVTECIRLGAAWVTAVYWLDSSYAWWLLLPVVGPLALSIPISVYSSRVSLGRACAAPGCLCIPRNRIHRKSRGAPRSTPTGPNPRRASSTPLSIPA